MAYNAISKCLYSYISISREQITIAKQCAEPIIPSQASWGPLPYNHLIFLPALFALLRLYFWTVNTLSCIAYISINIKFCSQHFFFSFHLKEIIVCGQIFNFNSDRTWCFWAASTIIFLFFFSVLQVSQPLLQIGWTAWQITLVPNWSQFNMIFVTKKLWKYHHLEIYRSLCIGLLSKLSSINFSPLSILQPDMFPNKKSPRSLWTTIMPEAKQSISISY